MTTSAPTLEELALGGHTEALKTRGKRNVGTLRLRGLVCKAIYGGHVGTVELLHEEWGAKEYDYYLVEAASTGNTNIMTTIMMWAPADFDWKLDWPLKNAAAEGRVEAIELLKSWGAKDFEGARWYAASSLREMGRLKWLRGVDFKPDELVAVQRLEKVIQLLSVWESQK